VAGWSFTIVSSLVPLTVLINTTATLVYLHSRYVEQPDELPIDEHQALALANKFLPCTASVFAAAVGFAALAVSRIRPIYEMGLWTAGGLAMSWVVCFTLFPALQRALRTPTHRERAGTVRWFPALVDRLIPFSYRWRWLLVAGSVLIMALGCAALFGVPGVLRPMPLETDALDYVDRDLPVYRDTRKFESAVAGLNVTDIWIRTAPGGVLDPGLLRGLELFARELEADPHVGSVAGPTTLLRWARYAGGAGDRLPVEPAAWPKLASGSRAALADRAAGARIRRRRNAGERQAHRDRPHPRAGDNGRDSWLPRGTLAGRGAQGAGAGSGAHGRRRARPVAGEDRRASGADVDRELRPHRGDHFRRLPDPVPQRAGADHGDDSLGVRDPRDVRGDARHRHSAQRRDDPDRLDVLGASENDQIHFFYHFQERRKGSSAESALRHAMLVAGRAILFATLINAGGFLALAFSDLPPMRQFGIVSAAAFVLGMVADFTALPAALWIVFHAKPDERAR
jgi:hypothetical protein